MSTKGKTVFNKTRTRDIDCIRAVNGRTRLNCCVSAVVKRYRHSVISYSDKVRPGTLVKYHTSLKVTHIELT